MSGFTHQDIARIVAQPGYGVDTAVTAPGNAPEARQRDEVGSGRAQGAIVDIYAPANEREMQQMIFDNLPVYEYPLLALLFAIPNHWREGQRPPPGQKAGVPDILLPVACYPHHGLFIELKMPGTAKKYQPRPNQEQWHKDLRAQGYAVEVCKSVDAAIGLLCGYLRGEYAPF